MGWALSLRTGTLSSWDVSGQIWSLGLCRQLLISYWQLTPLSIPGVLKKASERICAHRGILQAINA